MTEDVTGTEAVTEEEIIIEMEAMTETVMDSDVKKNGSTRRQ